MPKTITILSKYFDGTVRKTWTAELLSRDDNLLLLRGIFENTIEHSELGVIAAGTISYEYYWLDKWYNVFRFHEPDGSFRNFYCNVNTPPTLNDDVLEYVDLDLDIIVDAAGSQRLLDVAEYEAHADRFGYPGSIRSYVENAIRELTDMIESRKDPFVLSQLILQDGVF